MDCMIWEAMDATYVYTHSASDYCTVCEYYCSQIMSKQLLEAMTIVLCVGW